MPPRPRFLFHTPTRRLFAIGAGTAAARCWRASTPPCRVLMGGVEREVRVEVDPAAMAALGVTVTDLSRALAAVSRDAWVAARDDVAGPLHEGEQGAVVAGAQGHRLAVAGDGLACHVPHHVAAGERRHRLAYAAPGHGAHARPQLAEFDGFHQVVVGAGIQAGDALGHLGTRSRMAAPSMASSSTSRMFMGRTRKSLTGQ